MKNRVKITSSTGHKLEVGQNTLLTASDYKGKVTWKADHEHLVRLKNPHGAHCATEGIGFGKVTLTVTDDDGISEPFTLYVGSVVIAGADGQYWQLTSDGQATSLQSQQLAPEVTHLVHANAIIADLTGKNKSKANEPVAADTTTDPSEAVTCYVLNLKSFTLK